VRYDNMISKFQAKILEVEAAMAQYRRSGQLPPPEQLGFLVKPATGLGAPSAAAALGTPLGAPSAAAALGTPLKTGGPTGK
jgi:hypothetical protein